MASKNEVRGVTAKKKKPLVIPVQDDPQNQWISKAEFMKKRAALKAANQAAEEARARVLAEAGVSPVAQAAPAQSPSELKIAKLRKQLADASKRLQDKPDSKAFAKKVAEFSEELEALEAESE